MEIEFKLSCTPETASALGRHLSRLTGASPQKIKLQNTYYDTPQQDLRMLGIALRIRQQQGKSLQTVKCAGQVSGGLSSRPEWETPYGGRFDFSPIGDETVRSQLEALARLPGFRATLDTNFTRHLWHWRPEAGTHVEIMLDRGHIIAGGRREAICELELELIEGEAERLFDLVAYLGELAPLFPAPLSKATRGSLLLTGNNRFTTPLPDTPVDDCEAAFAQLAQTCLDHISVNLPTNCAGFEAENIHQVRVGMRRLRALLELYRPLLRNSWCLREMEDGARTHMRALAAARSLQVLLGDLVGPPSTAAPRTLRRLHERMSAMADEASSNARAHLLSLDFARWLLHASLALHVHPVRERLRNEAWPEVAQKSLAARLKKYEQRLRRNRSTPKQLHELRKAGKHLRYQLAVCGCSGSHHGKALGRRLAQLQDSLGQLNDLYSAGEMFSSLPASFSGAVMEVGRAHVGRHAALRDALPKQLRRLRRELTAMRKKETPCS
jgi:inorganic triphosphatase YgiF